MLSDDGASDTESLYQLTINEHYAKAFEYKKEREELQKLKDKYGSDFEEDEEEETDSESDESEDEDGEELTPTVDAAILRTLARIKRKDPGIYDSSKNIFGEEQHKVTTTAKPVRAIKDKSKPITIRQVALESVLNPDERSPSPENLPHVEEQRVLRDETIAAFQHAVDKDEDEDAFLIPREKTRDEREQEEEEYRAFLKREVGEDLRKLVTTSTEANDGKASAVENSEKRSKKKGKRGQGGEGSPEVTFTKSVESSNQEFLMNYILNRGWIDRSANRIPTYGEITSSKKASKRKKKKQGASSEGSELGEDETDDAHKSDLDDEEFDEIVDRFESSYNFRYEEPDAAVIPTHPRNVTTVVRREDTRRKEARERRKRRKEEELQKRKEEIKRLKNLKMKDIRARLERIGREGGKKLEESAALQKLDLDGDWDPAAHDRQMAEIYGHDGLSEDEKPQWDEEIDIGDIDVGASALTQKKKEKKKKKKYNTDNERDVGVDVDAMDADQDRQNDDEEWDGTEEMRKRKLDEYMEEMYNLDFNGLVGDLPTRFKYVQVQSDSFALTPVEILVADDQELNEYMSIKKYAPYRKQGQWDSRRRDRLKELKDKLAERIASGGSDFAGNGDAAGSERPTKKRKGKKERLRLRLAQDGGDEEMSVVTLATEDERLKRKNVSRELEEAEKVTGKKRKRKHTKAS